MCLFPSLVLLEIKMKRRTLVSWIGATDFASMGNALGGAIREQVEQAINRPIRDSEKTGPIKALMESEEFDSIHLLNNYHQSLEETFVDWIGVKAETHHIDSLKTPTDYTSIYLAVDNFLTELFENEKTRPSDLCIYLSPGTPAMVACWVLIGKNKYDPTFIQSYKGQCSVTEIPFDLKLHIKDIVSKSDAALEFLRGTNPEEFEAFADLIGESDAMKDAIGKAQLIAIRDVPVLLLGETGTGKTYVAERIHLASTRAGKEFKTVNCAALPPQLLESELFGHVKGAFTGADSDKAGLFETANNGTIFLDEIGECPLALQAKLLSVLQPVTSKGPSIRKIRRVGGEKEFEVDVRVITATNRSLIELVNEKLFREDLYYRLAALTIQLPPLRERREDIPPLSESLLAQINESFAKNDPDFVPRKLTAAASDYVQNQRWPGNVRQIYFVLLQAAVISAGEEITEEDLIACEAEVPGRSSRHILDRDLDEDFDFQETLNIVRRNYIEKALKKAGGVPGAVKLLGYNNAQTLRNHIKELGIDS